MDAEAEPGVALSIAAGSEKAFQAVSGDQHEIPVADLAGQINDFKWNSLFFEDLL